jgi:hypothetical protein
LGFFDGGVKKLPVPDNNINLVWKTHFSKDSYFSKRNYFIFRGKIKTSQE